MLVLQPMAHETIWGGKRLCSVFEQPPEKVGHLYSLYDNEKSNMIMNGNWRGATIHDWFIAHRDLYRMESFASFPIVLAIVDAEESLSIQVHPDDECARSLEHVAWGKNESWYFLEPPTDGKIFAGCNIFEKSRITQMIQCGRTKEVIGSVNIKAGDYIYIEAGTLHAMTAGSLVYEIEENSEYTYRFYDYERCDSNGNCRELHTEKALLALKPPLTPKPRRYDGAEIEERFYSTVILNSVSEYTNCSEMLECITILSDLSNAYVDNVQVKFGTTVVLEPGESLMANLGTIAVARVKSEVFHEL